MPLAGRGRERRGERATGNALDEVRDGVDDERAAEELDDVEIRVGLKRWLDEQHGFPPLPNRERAEAGIMALRRPIDLKVTGLQSRFWTVPSLWRYRAAGISRAT